MIKFFKIFGYQSIPNPYPPLTDFQEFILRALKEMTIRETAVITKASLATVQRWASGQTEPINSFKKHIINVLMPEVERRERELLYKFLENK